MTETLPYLTADLPGIGGVIKESAADFRVSELPLYQPCGSGEHTYLLIEKEGITTLEALRRLARELRIPERELGCAGLKDAKGITRQTISVPRSDPALLLSLEIPGLKPLAAERHTNKLRLGHLAGNRFRIRIRGVDAAAAESAGRVVELLCRRGIPNYFGSQRYGAQGNSHLIGLALLRGDDRGAITALIGDPAAIRDERWRSAIEAFREGRLAESLALFPGHCRTEREVLQRLTKQPDDWQRAVRAIHPRLVSLYLSACQSALFDRLLAGRLPSFDRLLPGDVACKHDNGACFLVEEVETALPRAAAFEISPTGPLFGRRMLQPLGAPAAMEAELLAAHGIDAELFAATGPYRLEGERRPLRVPLREPSLSGDDEGLILEFSLPKGSYATTVLREIMKNERMDRGASAATLSSDA